MAAARRCHSFWACSSSLAVNTCLLDPYPQRESPACHRIPSPSHTACSHPLNHRCWLAVVPGAVSQLQTMFFLSLGMCRLHPLRHAHLVMARSHGQSLLPRCLVCLGESLLCVCLGGDCFALCRSPGWCSVSPLRKSCLAGAKMTLKSLLMSSSDGLVAEPAVAKF